MMNRLFPVVRTALQVSRRSHLSKAPVQISWFSSTSSAWAKKVKATKKGGRSRNEELAAEPTPEVAEVDFTVLEAEFKQVIELYKTKVTEVKLGKSNPKIFDHLKVDIHKKELPFTQVAQTNAQGGRNLIITVFDPSDAKNVVSAILAADMNINPQQDPNNSQLLKVQLPPPSADSKVESIKALKREFDYLKTANANKSSLTDIRGRAIKPFKNSKMSDIEKKIIQDIEKIYKKYVDLLADTFKAAEKSLLK
ncbi:hypothetical protein BABINDRAFT_6409 [Babjeviella inositovora NRRL Y-12698]|uniref:Ribosome-recycling factor, mitochondrial n=1 Tax=Babjeviella inositovora NRRL Y-12698 TaxID=984486 RepID=A0A1E3QVR5_9ASCO|nr:uncharacterized protein BABINDRAFT_6409 [Babjeviella inositovora NRRL Y-12698]ODQ81755.1 hypothetical protein BABINDRAFT_6409 [Babjeviella inositovora NRRL Y-12698]